MTRDPGGYALDIPHLRDFKPMLARAWLDHVAVVAVVRPRLRPRGTAALLAATHPSGEFHGVDAIPVHIDHARTLAAATYRTFDGV
jgi:hypothetical protein